MFEIACFPFFAGWSLPTLEELQCSQAGVHHRLAVCYCGHILLSLNCIPAHRLLYLKTPLPHNHWVLFAPHHHCGLYSAHYVGPNGPSPHAAEQVNDSVGTKEIWTLSYQFTHVDQNTLKHARISLPLKLHGVQFITFLTVFLQEEKEKGRPAADNCVDNFYCLLHSIPHQTGE